MPSYAQPVDPVRCWVRHVRRTVAGETGTTIAAAVFIREPEDALGGRQGWQEGTVTAALSDTGELKITLPNAVGEDGKRHARRFAYFTNDAYRPGEEWLEVYREPSEILAVCTPYKGRKDRNVVELIGYDVAGLLNRFRGSELDVWDGHAPRDVFEHYTRLPGLILGTDFTGFTLPNVGGTGAWAGTAWSMTNTRVGPHGGPRLGYLPALATPEILVAPAAMPAGQQTDCWSAEFRGRIVRVADAAAGYLKVRQGGIGATILFDGRVRVDGTSTAVDRASGPPGPDAYGKLRVSPTGAISVRVVVRYDRCWLLINGEVVCDWRRNIAATPTGVSAWDGANGSVSIACSGGIVDVDSYHIEVLRPFAMRGADKGSYRLPGIPPPGGLRARYYNAAGAQANFATYPARISRALDLSSEPTIDRLEPALDLPKGDTVPSMAGAYLARWTGSIYLDLAASDRQIRLGEQGGYVRVLIGKTIRNRDELLNRWPTAPNFADLFLTNYLRASSAAFETDTTGWATTGIPSTGAALTRVTDDTVIHGAGVGKVVTTNATAAQGVQAVPDPALLTTFLASLPYRAVVYLRGAVGGEVVRVGLGGSGDSAQTGNIVLPGPTAAPVAVQIGWTPTADRSATTFGVFVTTAAATAVTFYVDRARITRATVEATGLESSFLRSIVGSEAGWYPIVVEAYKPDNLGGFLLEDRNTADASATAWQLVPSSRLSPIGTYEERNRNESLRSVIDAITETFGYQWRTDPKSLETGEFPGQIIPRVRVGRDSDKVIDDTQGIDVVVDSAADDTIDSLLADAAGIADPTGSGQLSAQVIDYANALAHLGMHTGYESLSEMSERTGLETRLGSLLALGSSPSEQVGVRPPGTTELTDTWPLSGALARLRWQPGDGVRLELKDVDVVDRTPRQLTRVERVIRPDAIAAPVVGFRQRPRSPAAVLKRALRGIYALSRNYQGTMTLIPGTHGSATGNGASPTAVDGTFSTDTFTRLPLPVDLTTIDRVWMHVSKITASTTAVIEINAVSTGIIVTGPGLYEVTPYVARASAGTQQRCFGRLINGTVGNAAEYDLLGRYRI
jgi:hypothetical protein